MTQTALAEQIQSKIRPALLAEVRHFNLKGEIVTRTFDLSTHDGRVACNKLVMWAMNMSVELRITRKAN